MITPVSEAHETKSTLLEDQELIKLSFASLSPSNCQALKPYRKQGTTKQLYILAKVWKKVKCDLYYTGRNELNKLTLLPTCGFIAQLVEHRTGIRGGHGFESR